MVLSLYDVLLLIRWDAEMAQDKHDKLVFNNPEYLKGWLDHKYAIEKSQDALFESLEKTGVNCRKKFLSS